MSALRSVAIFVTPLLVLGTMAVGLRLGAEPPGVAALVVVGPPPKTHDRWVVQLRVLREERRIRENAPGIEVTIGATRRGGGNTATWRGKTNDEGVAEAVLTFAAPALAPDEAIDLVVRGEGAILAEGTVRVPSPAAPSPLGPAKPARAEGPLAIDVLPPPGGLAPEFASGVWVVVHDVDGHAISGARVTAEPDPGLEVAAPAKPTCAAGATFVPLRAMGHSLGARFVAEAPDGAKEAARGTWYGGLPVVPGGDEITLEPPAPREGEPLRVRVRSATMKPLVYAEVLDEEGRVFAASAPVARAATGFGEATIEVPGLARGRHFVSVSSRAEGFALGTAVARGFGVGGVTFESCTELLDVGVRPPPAFDRAPRLDGFDLRRAEAARIRAKGKSLAMGSLAVGGLLAGLMLATSLKRSAPHPTNVDDPEAIAITKSATPRWLVIVILLGLSCLAYFLLAGLVLFSGN